MASFQRILIRFVISWSFSCKYCFNQKYGYLLCHRADVGFLKEVSVLHKDIKPGVSLGCDIVRLLYSRDLVELADSIWGIYDSASRF